MKKIVSLLLVVVMLFGITATLSSCNKKGAEIKIYLGDQLYDLDPALTVVSDDMNRVLSLIFEPLFTLNENGKVVKALAKSYKIIEDEEKDLYQMEITLRETYWNDGKSQVVADDLLDAWSRILDPNFQTQAAPLLYDIKNAVAIKNGSCSVSDLGVEANRDVLTITFEKKIDYDAFLRNLTSVALSPVRNAKVLAYPKFWAQKGSFIATNGPFAIRTWNKDTGEFTLQKNDYYRSEEGENSYVYPAILASKWTDENFWNYMDGNNKDINKFLESKMEAFLEEAVFCMGSMPADKAYREQYAESIEAYDAFSTYSYIFNTEKELFADEDVRKALSMVLDREYIASELLFAKAADGLISPAVWESTKKKVSFRSKSESLIATSAKVSEAQALLAGKNLPTKQFVLSVRNSSDDLFIANYAVEQWAKLGFSVSINVVTVDKQVWTSDSKNGGRVETFGSDSKITIYDDGITAMYMEGEFDVLGLDYQMYSTNAFAALAGFSTTMNGNGVLNGFDESTGQSKNSSILHCSGFSDEAYDAIIQRAYKEKDLDKRAAILHEAEAYLMDKLPIAPIVYNQNYFMIEGISGIDVDGYGNLVFTKAKAPLAKLEENEAEEEE